MNIVERTIARNNELARLRADNARLRKAIQEALRELDGEPKVNCARGILRAALAQKGGE